VAAAARFARRIGMVDSRKGLARRNARAGGVGNQRARASATVAGAGVGVGDGVFGEADPVWWSGGGGGRM